jgi:RNA polymerase-binding transcription factor DksA
MKGRTNKLEHELEKVQDQITTLKQALDTRSDYGLGRGDPGFAGREVNRALLERFEEREEGLKQAISETNRSEYGFCEKCGRPIHPDRLAVLPDTRICIRCARSEQE